MDSRGPGLKTWPLCTVITVCKTCGEEVIFLRLKEADIKIDHKGKDKLAQERVHCKVLVTTIPLADENSTPASWLGGPMFKYWSTGHLY